jgi:glycosyltransferase involved in cell wall biosynthesis
MKNDGIELSLIYGQPDLEEAKKKDTGDISWAKKIRNVYIKIGSRHLIWQPCLRSIRESDIIIVEQASKLILNYYLIFKQTLGGAKIVFWGHGWTINERKPSRLAEAAKKYLTRKVHWWFAYSQKSADIVARLGFPRDRITIVQNSIDTNSLEKQKGNASDKMIADLKVRMNMESSHTAIYVGGLYKEKKIAFLLEAAAEIRRTIPDFHLIVIGAGPEQQLALDWAKRNTWIYYLGPLFGEQRVPYLKIADVFLLPGSVGLAIIDSFVFETPLITLDLPTHGPEIGYLENGKNGLMLNPSAGPIDYARAVSDLLRNREKMNRLMEGCCRSAKRYTIDAMVSGFAEGVGKAIRAITSY